MEASYFNNGGTSRLTFDGLNFRFINLNALTGHNIAKRDNLRSECFTLFMLGI